MQEETSESMPDPPTPGQLNPNELQQLFELAPFGIGVFDRYFRCRSVNQTLADINGLSREDHYGKYLRDIVPTLALCWNPCFNRSSAAVFRSGIEPERPDGGPSGPATTLAGNLQPHAG